MLTPAAASAVPRFPTTPGASSFSTTMTCPSGTASTRNPFTRTMRASRFPYTVPATRVSPPCPRTRSVTRLAQSCGSAERTSRTWMPRSFAIAGAFTSFTGVSRKWRSRPTSARAASGRIGTAESSPATSTTTSVGPCGASCAATDPSFSTSGR